MSSTYDDAWLTDAISAATKYVEGRCNRCYQQQTRSLKMRTFADSRYVHNRKVYFPRGPILGTSTISVTYLNSNGTSTTLPTTDYVISAYDVPGHLAEAYSATWPDTYNQENDVTISYRAGTTTVPPVIKLAVNMLVGHWYRTREAATDRAFADVPYGIDALLGSEQVELYG